MALELSREYDRLFGLWTGLYRPNVAQRLRFEMLLLVNHEVDIIDEDSVCIVM
jgi:hypothetical protein